jgi:hypothetical protein
MVARRLSCRAPSGREFPIVVLGDVVIAPETACKEPGLGWLELEGIPRLTTDVSQRLERVIDGLRIGSWPFSAPLERWNEAAEFYPCLAVAIDDEAATSVVANCELSSSDLGVPKQDVALGRRPEQSRDRSDLMTGDRLRSGSRGVIDLFIGIRRALGLIATGLALAACVYYVLGVDEALLGSVVQVAHHAAPSLVARREHALARGDQVGPRLGVGDCSGDELGEVPDARFGVGRERLVAGLGRGDHAPQAALHRDRAPDRRANAERLRLARDGPCRAEE